ncbi:PadR family transcriptional regulator [Deinococcus koreensis]|uniref:PadR family transcriptional regulator n=1 Tax=Deinococcus koreensis TaxID=2054903 RepID=A0A2K3V011_9DEIO|nr:helix-turn-helix transcriptional regulator [Deinococcus koreensis]PNY82119.1 PadR family transcriptional regulator [Deinococcus koreensis]
MTDASLGPSAYIVLGFIARCGPSTSYDLKRWADGSVGYFWTFPRSQLYAEPQRLSDLGLLSESQEEGGRRRRLYTVTGAGQRALEDWLRSPAGFPELRDPGLLRMFFMEAGDPAPLRALAQEQLALHRARLAEYETQAAQHGPGPQPLSRRTLRMGFLYEHANITFWEEVLAECPE